MTDSNNNIPSRDPANDDNMAGMFGNILQKFLQNVDDMLPAQIITFDRATNMATVQPLIKVVTTNGDTLSRPQIASVPVLQIGGGGFVMNFNLKAGDFGYIKANDRDTSLLFQSNSEAAPNSKRKHSFEDGIFIPAVQSAFAINGEDGENAVFQNLAGTTRVAIWNDRVKITVNGTDLILQDGQLTIDATQTTINGNLTVTGQTVLQGNVNAQANVAVGGNLTNAGTTYATHKHGGVQSGNSTTGAPQ